MAAKRNARIKEGSFKFIFESLKDNKTNARMTIPELPKLSVACHHRTAGFQCGDNLKRTGTSTTESKATGPRWAGSNCQSWTACRAASSNNGKPRMDEDRNEKGDLKSF
jgi:hypothetical protein